MRTPACVAAIAALTFPLSAAADPGSGGLALMPLPRRELGPGAAALVSGAESGTDSNADAARHAGGGVTAAALARSGRINGYTLDYRRPPTLAPPGGRALLEVQTIAERYRDPRSARGGLAFWKAVTQRLPARTVNGISTAAVPFVARVADGAFAFELTYTRAGRPVAYVGDVVFRTRSLLGAVFVTATDRAGLRARTVALARKLATRIRLVQAGRIRR
jgi:hypothetical protein